MYNRMKDHKDSNKDKYEIPDELKGLVPPGSKGIMVCSDEIGTILAAIAEHIKDSRGLSEHDACVALVPFTEVLHQEAVRVIAGATKGKADLDFQVIEIDKRKLKGD